jgi:hypothetical protein
MGSVDPVLWLVVTVLLLMYLRSEWRRIKWNANGFVEMFKEIRRWKS